MGILGLGLSLLGEATPAAPVSSLVKGCANPIRSTDYLNIESKLNDKAKKPIESLAEFVACLPNEFFESGNNTYVTESRSPEADDVSEETPRVILFGKDARTTIAYTGKHDGASIDQARMIVSDPAQTPAKNRFITVDFVKGQYPRITEGDTKCVRCHDGHHIWGSYRDWKGTFGPKTDLEWVREDEGGYKSFMAFWRNQAASPYYSRLLQQQRGDNGIVPEPQADFRPRNPYAPASGGLLDAVMQIQARVLQGKMTGNPLYEGKKHLLASTYLGCTVPKPIEADMEAFLKSKFDGSDIWKTYITAKNDRHSSVDIWENNIKNLRIFMLSEVMGAPYKSWPLTLHTRPNKDLLDDDGPAYNRGSGITLLDGTIREIARDLTATHGNQSDIARMFKAEHWKNPYYSFINPRYQSRIPGNYPAGFKEECRILEPYVLTEQPFIAAAVEKTPAQTPAKRDAPAFQQDVQFNARRDFQKYCSRCHGPSGNEVELSLHDIKSLAGYVSTDGTKNIVQQYLADSTMPPKRAKLHPTPEERDNMLKAIKALSR